MATSEDLAFQNAKAYLMKNSTVSNMNTYDHLSQIINRLLDERPENGIDVIEDLSRDLKRSQFTRESDTIHESKPSSEAVALAEAQAKLFELPAEQEEGEADEDIQPLLPNVLENAFYFEQTGVGLSKEEMFRIFLALKKLSRDQPVETVRFWGKLFGTEANYIVAEVEFKDGEGEEEDQLETEEDAEPEVPQREASEEQEEEEEEPDEPPKSQYKPPPVIPREENRIGTNKKTFFVTNEPGSSWVRLPLVTPAQIVTARKIRKFLTGRLDAPIASNPPFPGNEANYVRTQIQRISAAAQVSPINYYQFEEEEEEEEEEARDSFIVNTEFEGMPSQELADPTLSGWVHHVQYVLPQGRCVWYNPVQKAEEEFEDEEEEEEREEPDEPNPEKGPPLLTPLSEDLQVDSQPPWSTTLSTSFSTSYNVVGIHSNRWPGAHAYAIDRKFENIYIGWGLKYQAGCFQPELPGAGEKEHPNEETITEIDDPTPEEEAAVRAAQEGAEQEEEEEEEEEEDDD